MPLDYDALYECAVFGETNAIGIDMTGDTRQNLVEDCPIRCRPLRFAIHIDRDGDAFISSIETNNVAFSGCGELPLHRLHYVGRARVSVRRELYHRS